ncbi:unnamed protein product [Lepeophtheirus salmonis]|uniref:(salmon louse) hypothetical protein n=1 Tax=Lepeophtheirus salmonis TaxID=72036 RepID=A0A7R8CIP3_LEPSM|nr:unnamed protein product [Lepeophtheirus salmonis]CAF2835370.1 unnamed protein product [Lepeophtheirus salmonis]
MSILYEDPVLLKSNALTILSPKHLRPLSSVVTAAKMIAELIYSQYTPIMKTLYQIGFIVVAVSVHNRPANRTLSFFLLCENLVVELNDGMKTRWGKLFNVSTALYGQIYRSNALTILSPKHLRPLSSVVTAAKMIAELIYSQYTPIMKTLYQIGFIVVAVSVHNRPANRTLSFFLLCENLVVELNDGMKTREPKERIYLKISNGNQARNIAL